MVKIEESEEEKDGRGHKEMKTKESALEYCKNHSHEECYNYIGFLHSQIAKTYFEIQDIKKEDSVKSTAITTFLTLKMKIYQDAKNEMESILE